MFSTCVLFVWQFRTLQADLITSPSPKPLSDSQAACDPSSEDGVPSQSKTFASLLSLSSLLPYIHSQDVFLTLPVSLVPPALSISAAATQAQAPSFSLPKAPAWSLQDPLTSFSPRST